MYRNSYTLNNIPGHRLSQEANDTQRNYDDHHLHRSTALSWAIFGIILVAILAIVVAFATHFYYSPTMPYYGGWWFIFPFGFFFFIFIVFFVSRFLFWPWGWGRRGYWYGYGYGDPKDIIKRRYARGEITKEQFDQMLRDLEQHA